MDTIKQEIEIELEKLNEIGQQEVLRQIRLLREVPRMRKTNSKYYFGVESYFMNQDFSKDQLDLIINFARYIKSLSPEKIEELKNQFHGHKK